MSASLRHGAATFPPATRRRLTSVEDTSSKEASMTREIMRSARTGAGGRYAPRPARHQQRIPLEHGFKNTRPAVIPGGDSFRGIAPAEQADLHPSGTEERSSAPHPPFPQRGHRRQWRRRIPARPASKPAQHGHRTSKPRSFRKLCEGKARGSVQSTSLAHCPGSPGYGEMGDSGRVERARKQNDTV